MGSVIGQRGSIIKEIRALTTPDIKIHEQEDGATYRKLHVAGELTFFCRVSPKVERVLIEHKRKLLDRSKLSFYCSS